jgi:hypothetical protein
MYTVALLMLSGLPAVGSCDLLITEHKFAQNIVILKTDNKQIADLSSAEDHICLLLLCC